MRKVFSIFLAIFYLINCILPSSGLAGMEAVNGLLPAGVSVSGTVLRGVKVYLDNPLRLDFILDKGDIKNHDINVQTEANKLVKYFLASMTVPDQDMWVNLSPYEKDRVIPLSFGQTEMGREMLDQDYILKQVTARLMNPQGALGQKFWDAIYTQAQKQFGTSDIPVDSFNKVWIVPEKAVVFEGNGSAYIVESHLKVLLDQDYLAVRQQGVVDVSGVLKTETQQMGLEIVRDIMIPELEKEVNTGAEFAELRQIYSAYILAAWYKKRLKTSILNQVYADLGKTSGIAHGDPQAIAGIWDSYVQAFKQGAYNFIREEYDAVTQEIVPRQYFSGGMKLDAAQISYTSDAAMLSSKMAAIGGVAALALAAVSFVWLPSDGTVSSVASYSTSTQQIVRFTEEEKKAISGYLEFFAEGRVSFSPFVSGEEVVATFKQARDEGHKVPVLGPGFIDFYENWRLQIVAVMVSPEKEDRPQVIDIPNAILAKGERTVDVGVAQELFFQGVWTYYFNTLKTNDQVRLTNIEELMKQQMQRIFSGDLRREFMVMLDKIIKETKEKGPLTQEKEKALHQQWFDFNMKYFVPRGYYVYLQLKDTHKGLYYDTFVYKIDTKATRNVKGKDVQVFYGRAVEGYSLYGQMAYSFVDKKIVLVDTEAAKAVAELIWKVKAEGQPYTFEGLGKVMSPPVVTEIMKNAFADVRNPEEVVRYVSRSISDRVLAYQLWDIMDLQSQPLNDFWMTQKALHALSIQESPLAIKREMLVMLAQLYRSERPAAELVAFLPNYLTRKNTVESLAAFWLFNTLDGRDLLKNGLSWQDSRELLVQVERLAKHPNLKDTVKGLIKKHYSADVLEAIDNLDKAQNIVTDTSKDRNVGGIDFDGRNMDFIMRSFSGQNCDEADASDCVSFTIQPELLEELRAKVGGVAPVNMQILPLTDLPHFLGVKG